jgi:hypothetical protein
VRVALLLLLCMNLLDWGGALAQAPKPPAKAVAPAGPRVWLAREVAQISEQQVWLFGQDGSSVGIARTEQLRTLLGVFGKLEHQSGISSELYLSEGNDPDTWLAQGKGDQIVIRVSLGLLTMLGADWDAWAFVIGHQLAHIDMHARQRIELQQRQVGEPPPPARTPDEEEKIADGLGLEWAIRAGYKAQGASLFLHRLVAREGPASSFMRRHPFYPGRIDYVRDLGATLSAGR